MPAQTTLTERSFFKYLSYIRGCQAFDPYENGSITCKTWERQTTPKKLNDNTNSRQAIGASIINMAFANVGMALAA